MNWLEEVSEWLNYTTFDLIFELNRKEHEKVKVKAIKLLQFLYDNGVEPPLCSKDYNTTGDRCLEHGYLGPVIVIKSYAVQLEWENGFEIEIRENNYYILDDNKEKIENDFNILLNHIKKVLK